MKLWSVGHRWLLGPGTPSPGQDQVQWAGECSLAAEEDKEWTSVEPFEVEEFCEEVVKKKEVIK